MFSSVGHLHPQHLGEGGERILICNRENGAQNKVTNNSIFVFFSPSSPCQHTLTPSHTWYEHFPDYLANHFGMFSEGVHMLQSGNKLKHSREKISHAEKCSFFPNIYLYFYNVVFLKAGEKFEQCHCGLWN